MTVTIDMNTNQPIPAPVPIHAEQYVRNPHCRDVSDAECERHPTCNGCPGDAYGCPGDGYAGTSPAPFPPPEESRYQRIAREIGNLVTEKQAAYGDSFGKSGDVMRTLYPNGIPPERLGDALVVVRVLDKLFRIATDRDAFGESPWRDIAGYALLAVGRAGRPTVH
jgi:hypothetical protein